MKVITQTWVGGLLHQPATQEISRNPAGPSSVGDDVGDRLAVDGEDHPLTRPDRIDYLAGPVS